VEIYLPIADIPVNIILLFVVGVLAGVLSVISGVSAGLVMTPLLISFGIGPAIAAATMPVPLAAVATLSTVDRIRRRELDVFLAGSLTCGGVLGTGVGVHIFNVFLKSGQVDTFIDFSFIALLLVLNGVMLNENIRTIIRVYRKSSTHLSAPRMRGGWDTFPFKVRYRNLDMRISPIPLVVSGFGAGVVGGAIGAGAGFVVVLLLLSMRVPGPNAVACSSAFTMVTMTVAAVLHATTHASVDAVLAFLLTSGVVFGALVGVRLGEMMRAETLRLVLGVVVSVLIFQLVVNITLPLTTDSESQYSSGESP
jgi:uncharacterized membrane protein YfcA